MKTLISSEARPTPVGPYSPALSVDGLLEAAGASLDDVVSCLVRLADLSDYAPFNGSTSSSSPARSPCEPL